MGLFDRLRKRASTPPSSAAMGGGPEARFLQFMVLRTGGINALHAHVVDSGWRVTLYLADGRAHTFAGPTEVAALTKALDWAESR